MGDPRYENPQLLIAAVRERLASDGENMRTQNDPQVCFFVDGDSGQYFIHGPGTKLYYDDDPADGCYSNTDKRLPDIVNDVISVVVRWDGRKTRMFRSMQDLVSWAWSLDA